MTNADSQVKFGSSLGASISISIAALGFCKGDKHLEIMHDSQETRDYLFRSRNHQHPQHWAPSRCSVNMVPFGTWS